MNHSAFPGSVARASKSGGGRGQVFDLLPGCQSEEKQGWIFGQHKSRFKNWPTKKLLALRLDCFLAVLTWWELSLYPLSFNFDTQYKNDYFDFDVRCLVSFEWIGRIGTRMHIMSDAKLIWFVAASPSLMTRNGGHILGMVAAATLGGSLRGYHQIDWLRQDFILVFSSKLEIIWDMNKIQP